MTGTVSKRKYRSGAVVWYFQIDLGNDENGKRQRLTESGFPTKAEAVAARDRYLVDKQLNRHVAPHKHTVSEFLNEWLEQHADRSLSGKTADRYRELLLKYVIPRIGGIFLKDLDPSRLERLYNDLRENGSLRIGGGPLSGKTVRHIHGTLHSAFAKAVRWRRLAMNPADSCDLPKLQKREILAPDQNEAQFIMDALLGTELYIPALLATFTGCRRGEILALTWNSIDFENRTIKVSRSLEQVGSELRFKETKTGKVRNFPLPHVVLDALRLHRQQQAKNREMFGKDYHTDLDLIVCGPAGGAIYPDRFTAAYCSMVKKIGKKGYSLHTLRHHHASLLLSKGVPVAAVSKRLGHSAVSTTMNVYAHAFSRDEVRAAEVIDEVFKGRKSDGSSVDKTQ